jgi:putative two-component system response regulator
MNTASKTKKILIVDDNRTMLKVLEKLLKSAGFEVVAADKGTEALRLAAQEKPHLIISDVNMPGMDGGELAARLKESPRTKRIPVVFLTSLITQKDAGARSKGDNIYLSKMTKPADLLEQIRKLI